MRRNPAILVVCTVIMSLVSTAHALLRPARADDTGQISLMQTLAEWKYPDSKMLGGASMSDGGNRLVQSIKCRAVLGTPDPIEKVIDFYSKKLVTPPDVILPGTKAEDLVPDGKSVSIQDDSQGRTVRFGSSSLTRPTRPPRSSSLGPMTRRRRTSPGYITFGSAISDERLLTDPRRRSYPSLVCLGGRAVL